MERLLAIALVCYIANAVPVLVAKVIKRRHPIDFGRYLPNGHRVLGDGKSIEGFISGIIAGVCVGCLAELKGFLMISEAFVLSLGAMTGDLLGSFIKRRIGLKSGDPAPLLDQLCFILTALAFYQVVFGLVDLFTFIIFLVITPPLHLATNYLAFKLKLKDKPW